MFQLAEEIQVAAAWRSEHDLWNGSGELTRDELTIVFMSRELKLDSRLCRQNLERDPIRDRAQVVKPRRNRS